MTKSNTTVPAATVTTFAVNVEPSDKIEAMLANGKILVCLPRAKGADGNLLPRTGKGEGKNLAVATTNGFQTLDSDIDGHPVVISMSAYVNPKALEGLGEQPSGTQVFNVPTVGTACMITKEMLFLAIDAAEPALSGTGKMMMYTPKVGAIDTGTHLGGESVIVNICLGYRVAPTRAEKKAERDATKVASPTPAKKGKTPTVTTPAVPTGDAALEVVAKMLGISVEVLKAQADNAAAEAAKKAELEAQEAALKTVAASLGLTVDQLKALKK